MFRRICRLGCAVCLMRNRSWMEVIVACTGPYGGVRTI
jgi:hypothetical protein